MKPIKMQGFIFLVNQGTGTIDGYPDTTKFAVDMSPEAVIRLMDEQFIAHQ